MALGSLVIVDCRFLGPAVSGRGPCVREDRRDMQAAKFVVLTLTEVFHSRLCLAIVFGFFDPQPSTHRRADRFTFWPDIKISGRDTSRS